MASSGCSKAPPKADFRANLTSIDRDRDGKSNEDGPNDLDGDGLAPEHALEGRQGHPDPRRQGTPRILRKADLTKGEKPVYSEGTEGIDEDGDGSIDEDPVGGVNLNRELAARLDRVHPRDRHLRHLRARGQRIDPVRPLPIPSSSPSGPFGLNDNLKGNPTTLPADSPHLTGDHQGLRHLERGQARHSQERTQGRGRQGGSRQEGRRPARRCPQGQREGPGERPGARGNLHQGRRRGWRRGARPRHHRPLGWRGRPTAP